MEKNKKLWNAIGFSMKAGKLVSGDFAVDKALKNGKAKLLLIDMEASAGTREKWQSRAEFKNIKSILFSNLGEAIGKPGRMVATVTDVDFAKMIEDKI